MKNLIHKDLIDEPVILEIAQLFNDFGMWVVLKKFATTLPSELKGMPPMKAWDISLAAILDGHKVFEIGCVRFEKDVPEAIRDLKPAIMNWLSQYALTEARK